MSARTAVELSVANRSAALENHTPSAGVLAQLVEHHNGIVGVRGSNPLGSRPSQGFTGRAAVSRQRAFDCGSEFFGFAAPPIMEEEDARVLVRHVGMDRHDIDARGAQCPEGGL
jgi:hypothetical protein